MRRAVIHGLFRCVLPSPAEGFLNGIRIALLVAGAVSLFASDALADPDPKFYIFLCFGQSNMDGATKIEPQDNEGIDERFRVLAAVDYKQPERKQGNWYLAVPPLCREYSGLCPADYFGRTMVANLPNDVRVGVVNVSVAGCRIELFDKDNYKAYTTNVPDWMANILKAYDNNPYQRLVDMAKIAQKDGVIKGILLHQGESNNGENQWPAKVKVVYENLIKDLNLKPEDVPLIAGELVNADQNGGCAGMNSIIAELPKTIPNSHVISSAGCPCQEDHIHFTAAGHRMLGKRYAEKMLTLLAYSIAGSNQPATRPSAP